MSKKLVRVAAAACMAATLAFTPTVALAGMTHGAGVRCLVMIDTPWGEFCLIPDVLN